MVIKPNGETVIDFKDGELGSNFNWTKGWIYKTDVAGAYTIKKIEDKTYLFWEWKSGDYVYGHLKPHYYVFVKEY